MSTPRASSADEPPEEENRQPSSLLSLPEEIVLSCLARVPRNCHLNLALVSKTLRALVCSPELNQLRSLLHRNSIYLCFRKDATTYNWLTLHSIEKTRTSTIEYGFVPILFPSHSFMYSRLTVTVGSDMYFLGRSSPSDLWILDTRSGKLTQGPSMKVVLTYKVVGVIDGKIYVIGTVVGCDEKIQVEVFEPETRIWKSAGEETMPPRLWQRPSIASLEGKVYIVEFGTTSVYSPREGRGKRMVHMVNERLAPREGGRKEMADEREYSVCVVENVIYASFAHVGLMWFDTKLKIWRRLLVHDENEVLRFPVLGMAEYEGKLAVFESQKRKEMGRKNGNHHDYDKSVKMFLIPLHKVGEKICGTIEWSGTVTTNTVPDLSVSIYPYCLVGSDGRQFI